MARGSKRSVGLVVLCAVALAGCGSRSESSTIHGRTLTIYSSLPLQGVSAAAARSVAAGQSFALSEAGARAAHRRVRLVRLESTKPGGHIWDPGLVSANVKRAVGDPSSVAYLGELDYGGSAVSVPVTNDNEIVQVSPGDSLASLTSVPPGRPQAGPARYYPTDERNFVRLGTSDLLLADVLLAQAREAGARRLAVVFDGQIYGRELAAELVARAREEGPTPVASEELHGAPTGMPGLVKDLAGDRPDALIYAGVAGPLTGPLFAALASGLHDVPVFGSSGVLARTAPLPIAPARVEAVATVPPPSELSTASRRLLRRIARHAGLRRVGAEALNGYESVRVVLSAVDRAGTSRRGIVHSAMKHRHTPFAQKNQFYLYRLDGGRFRFERELR
jgi:branched-chain amino acid transport system substrate-binding protein